MFFVMVEISNFRQLSRLRTSEASDIRALLEHFCLNRGGRLSREQNGFFLFAFHPLREKVLEQVSDFLFLTSESLQKKKDELFGFSLLLEQDDQSDEASVFMRLKSLIFLAPRESRVWAGPRVFPALVPLLPVSAGDPLTEILGPPQATSLPPLTVEHLLEMTGWIEALKTPLGRQLSDATESRQGKILRLKGSHLTEKYFVLRTVLHELYGSHDGFPVLFPLEDSQDFLSQLLVRVDRDLVRQGPRAADPAWEALLLGRGGGDYPGDSGRDDVLGALSHYFSTLVQRLSAQGLPPVFVFLLPQLYEPEAQSVLEAILTDLVARDGLRLLLLEPQDRGADFLGRHASLTWSFPPLTWERTVRERDARGWQDRFPLLDRQTLETCDGRGMAWVHHLWTLQERGTEGQQGPAEDPSWRLFRSLDSSHHKVYFVFWAGRGLIETNQLVEFFQTWGEDAAVIQDKVRSLGSMGFFPGGLSQTLRPDFGPWLAERLGSEGRELLRALGEFLYQKWKLDHGLSEVLFASLAQWGLTAPAYAVLTHYLTTKINQGEGDFLPLLRPALWDRGPSDEWSERLRLTAAAAKMRFSLNLKQSVPVLDRFRKAFTTRTDSHPHGEWQLQQGRWHLKCGDLSVGFGFLKRALLIAQEQDDRTLEVRAEVEIGLALLRKHRLEEGREYFEIAARLAEKTGSSYLVTTTAALDAVALFLFGNLTGALAAIDKGALAADSGGLRSWKAYLWFLKARVEFDQGDYARAVDTLCQVSAWASRYRIVEAVQVADAWRARAEAYSGNVRLAKDLLDPMSPSAERSFFLAELAYFERDGTALAHLAEARRLIPVTRPFGQGECADWSTGFAGIEDRALARQGDMGVLENQIDAFQLLIEGLERPTETLARRFQDILARKSLLDLDPVSAHYYYWYYLVIPKADSRQEAQRLTLLGRSLKDVQVRSSRIEEPTQRQDYLLKPYWNSQFAAEARRLKLL